MKCPSDGETLLMTTREGVEIDYCPKCRGVWLDRGELDKIIERSLSEAVPMASVAQQPPTPHAAHPAAPPPQQAPWQGRRRDDDDDDDRYRRGKRRRRESFLSELFDFD
ncbi:MAG: zf-TFIIB domain-containing protein [Rhodobacteraceae bacterium]|nr:zf-TFIIB domain-containing protein [Paracoccaceae bacterium]